VQTNEDNAVCVNDDHWTDHLNPAEQREVDEIELAILANKDEAAALRKKHRRWLEIGTSRKRRAAK
jgi:hypothetical protein